MKKSGIAILIIVLTLVITSILLLVFPKVNVAQMDDSEQDNKEEQEKVIYSYIIEDSFITNIKDSKRYVMASIAIDVEVDKEVLEEEALATFKDHEHVIRDTIVYILRSTTEEMYSEAKVQEELSAVIKDKVAEKLSVDTIDKIYFMELVVQ